MDMTLAAVVGSLRRDSINARTLGFIADAAPDGVEVRRLDIGDVPLYDGDREADGVPAVDALKADVLAADGLVIVTPEYNMAESGVTKNLVDWLSRPVLEGPINQRPIGLASTTPGRRGGAAALEHLSSILSRLNPNVYPETLGVASFRHRFDDDGTMHDDLREAIATWIAGFADFVANPPPPPDGDH